MPEPRPFRPEDIANKLAALDGLALALILMCPEIISCSNGSLPAPFQLTVHQGSTSSRHDVASTVLHNALIDSGFIQARVLLEFLGVGLSPQSEPQPLMDRMSKNNDDWTLVKLKVNPLKVAAIRSLTHRPFQHESNHDSIEQLLANLLRTSNKGFAHITSADTGGQPGHILAAALFTQLAVEIFFYKQQGYPVPDYQQWTKLLPSDLAEAYSECRNNLRTSWQSLQP